MLQLECLLLQNRQREITSSNIASRILSRATILFGEFGNALFHVEFDFVHGYFGIVVSIGLSVEGLAGAPAPAGPASPSEYVAVEKFLSGLENPPVAYQARRRLEASSEKLKESAWMEVETQYDPAVGLTDVVGLGRWVERGQPLATIHARDEASAEAAAQAIMAAVTIGAVPAVKPLIRDRIG